MGLMTAQSTNYLSIMIGGDAGQGVDRRPGQTEGGLDLFVAYSTDEAVDRCRCVFSTLKSTLDDQQSELISIHLPDSIQQIYAES